jgi:hypothetical protein
MHHRRVGLIEDSVIDVARLEEEVARSVDDCLITCLSNSKLRVALVATKIASVVCP